MMRDYHLNNRDESIEMLSQLEIVRKTEAKQTLTSLFVKTTQGHSERIHLVDLYMIKVCLTVWHTNIRDEFYFYHYIAQPPIGL